MRAAGGCRQPPAGSAAAGELTDGLSYTFMPALEGDWSGRIAGIFVVRNPDELRHLDARH